MDIALVMILVTFIALAVLFDRAIQRCENIYEVKKAFRRTIVGIISAVICMVFLTILA